MKTLFEQSEIEREGQFGFLRDAVRKITYALEAKADSDLNGLENLMRTHKTAQNQPMVEGAPNTQLLMSEHLNKD